MLPPDSKLFLCWEKEGSVKLFSVSNLANYHCLIDISHTLSCWSTSLVILKKSLPTLIFCHVNSETNTFPFCGLTYTYRHSLYSPPPNLHKQISYPAHFSIWNVSSLMIGKFKAFQCWIQGISEFCIEMSLEWSVFNSYFF